ncbi:MAG: lysophospholipid acyltransferase family protein [Actinomycetota bacterium]
MGERTYSVVIGAALGMIRGMKWTVTVIGGENVPASGPAVLASNHVGYLDFVFSGYAAREQGRRVRFLAKKEIFDKRGVGWLMRQMGHVPVDRQGAARESLTAAETELRHGEMIGMFPEATISPSFVPRRGKTGTVRLAQDTGAPLIPVAIWGTQRILTKWRPKNFRRRIPIIVNVGKPMDVSPDEDAQAVTDRLMERITELLGEAQARYPDQPERDEDRWWLPSHLGGSAPTPEDAERRLEKERAERARRREKSGTA